MSSVITAYLMSFTLMAFALALLFAGRSIAVVGRWIIGWGFAFATLAFGLALAVWLAATHLLAAVHVSRIGLDPAGSGAIVAGSAMIAIGALIRSRHSRRAPAPKARSATAAPAPRAMARSAPAPARSATPAATDAIAALVKLGYGRQEAATAVAREASSLGDGAPAGELVRAALRSLAS